mmetsp:Transcript_27529/g.42323  ORF Transcript_27529/g.42323 Transcript_27529/m.42323 type:complete len:264 (-) Transcript_27529:46-837(-)
MFATMPETEAKRYGDKTFSAMMYAKVITVQVVNSMGYHVLFQDVDVAWYKNPLDVFLDAKDTRKKEYGALNDFDIIFQDDGARSIRFAPHSANSGFYFVRYNAKTRYLFLALLYSSDIVLAVKSHQQALTALLSEHSSLFGLKVKTLPGEDFPGGFHYHRRMDMMHEIVEGRRFPWIFHMSWTTNKENKLKFFQQMGLWYTKCTDPSESAKLAGLESSTPETFVPKCCSSEPIVTCHYKDKPSVHPCPNSPNIDKGKRPFWKT